MLAYYPVSFQQ